MKPSSRSQSGITLVETAAAAGIIAVAVGGAFYAMAAFGKYVAVQAGPQRGAALALAEQTLRVAQNAWKYGSPGNAPAGTQSVALPGTVTTSIAVNGSSAHITVSVRYTPDPNHQETGVVSLSGDVSAKAPLPGALVDSPGLIPAPSGAP